MVLLYNKLSFFARDIVYSLRLNITILTAQFCAKCHLLPYIFLLSYNDVIASNTTEKTDEKDIFSTFSVVTISKQATCSSLSVYLSEPAL